VIGLPLGRREGGVLVKNVYKSPSPFQTTSCLCLVPIYGLYWIFWPLIETYHSYILGAIFSIVLVFEENFEEHCGPFKYLFLLKCCFLC